MINILIELIMKVFLLIFCIIIKNFLVQYMKKKINVPL